MKVHSSIILAIWVASLGASFLPAQAGTCTGDCCLMEEVSAGEMGCLMDQCPTMMKAAPFHPIPAVPVNAFDDPAILPQLATIRTIPLDLQLVHPTIQIQAYPLRLPILASPLLI